MEEMKEKDQVWKKIGELADGKPVIYNIRTKIIYIEEGYKYARNPSPDEKKEILKIIDKDIKKMKRWQRIIELIKKKL